MGLRDALEFEGFRVVSTGTGNAGVDLALMRASVTEGVQVKAAGGIRDLDGLIKVRDLGGSRCGATATAAMLEEHQRRAKEEQHDGAIQVEPGVIGQGGY